MARERGENGIKELENGKWQVRITYTDTGGKRRVFKRLAETVTEAKKLRKVFLSELDDIGENVLDGERMTFERLAEIYRKRRVFPAQYVNNRKVAGMRSHDSLSGKLNQLIAQFSRKRIKSFTASDIEAYKIKRLATPVEKEIKVKKISVDETGRKTVTVEKVKTETQRAISTVNRDLELMRAMFRFALREGWISRSPFDSGPALISKADETKRDRVLSHGEEKRLIQACAKPRRIHLQAIIVTAIDTAMRRGELFKLRWNDVDLNDGLIFIRAMNTKTQVERIVGMTPRIQHHLQKLFDKAEDNRKGLVFGITDTIKKAWKSACADAGIEELHFHDLRHTAITRMVNEGLPSAEIMKTSGHTQMTTFQRYVNPTTETARRNAERLANYNSARMSEIDETNDGFIN